ncbi:MAG: AraC family transcriptional regulator [Pleurocapsa sp. MO_226.B13]|nr:AraC family transcriptional regulator [Pleurocapsa sp. MO_226.B13]
MASSSPKPQTEAFSPIISSQDLGWQSILVEEYKQPSGGGEFGSCSEHIITLCLATKPHRIWQAMGDRSFVGLYSKGDLSITPAELPSSYRAYGEDSYLQIAISPQFLQQIATETINSDPDRLKLATEFRVRNPQIEQLAMMLRAELYRGSEGIGQLYIESLANALTVNLLRDHAGTKPDIVTYEGGLSDRALVRVTEYINEHLSQGIKLEDLASHIGITQFHFSRLFKKSTGMSPHQYVMQQRIERAKQLLKTADISIADIALDCGFSSQSHLGKYFRQLTGITPKAYRQS